MWFTCEMSLSVLGPIPIFSVVRNAYRSSLRCSNPLAFHFIMRKRFGIMMWDSSLSGRCIICCNIASIEFCWFTIIIWRICSSDFLQSCWLLFTFSFRSGNLFDWFFCDKFVASIAYDSWKNYFWISIPPYRSYNRANLLNDSHLSEHVLVQSVRICCYHTQDVVFRILNTFVFYEISYGCGHILGNATLW